MGVLTNHKHLHQLERDLSFINDRIELPVDIDGTITIPKGYDVSLRVDPDTGDNKIFVKKIEK